MKGKEFNYLKFKELIENIYGRRGNSVFCEKAKIDSTTFYSWTSGKNTKGPTAKAWHKIISEFSKKGVHVQINDFYNYNKPKENTTPQIIGEEPVLYNKDITAVLSEFIEKNEKMHAVLAERNETIIKQDIIIRDLKKQINEVKKQLKMKK